MWLTRRLPSSLGARSASSACSGGICSEPGRPAAVTAWASRGRAAGEGTGRGRRPWWGIAVRPRGTTRGRRRCRARRSRRGRTRPVAGVGRCCRVAVKPARRRTRKRYDSLTSNPSCWSVARMSARVAPWRRSSQARSWIASRFGAVLRTGLGRRRRRSRCRGRERSRGRWRGRCRHGDGTAGRVGRRCALVEVGAADLVAALGRGIGLLEEAREFLGASHRC